VPALPSSQITSSAPMSLIRERLNKAMSANT